MEEIEIQFRVALPEIEVMVILPDQSYVRYQYLEWTIPTVRDCSALWWCFRTSVERAQRESMRTFYHAKAKGKVPVWVSPDLTPEKLSDIFGLGKKDS